MTKKNQKEQNVDHFFDQRLLEEVSILQIQNEANEAEVRLTQECGQIIENLKKNGLSQEERNNLNNQLIIKVSDVIMMKNRSKSVNRQSVDLSN